MASAEPGDGPVSTGKKPALCMHLRSKGMYVYTDNSGGESDDDHESSVCWCLKTMKDFGPDDEFVSKGECRNPDRACYEPL